MSSPALEHGSRAFYRQEFERLRREFEATGSGRALLRDRTQFVDKLVQQLWEQHVSPVVRSGFALVALGGFGRGALFPHSDIDLLFLAENDALRGRMKDPVRSICQEMWDTGLRVSPTTRTLDDCARFDHDNVEFTISLLDCRFLTGDAKLFERLHEKSLPQLVARESDVLMQRLAEVTRTRHLRFGDTIFHLEPNLKDGPGGLRDLHVSRWLELIMTLASERKWSGMANPQPNSETDAVLDAMDFLTSSRCYLHYRGNRDENVISWEAQDDLAKRGGLRQGNFSGPIGYVGRRFCQRRSVAGTRAGAGAGTRSGAHAFEIGSARAHRGGQNGALGKPVDRAGTAAGTGRCGTSPRPLNNPSNQIN